MEGYVFEADVDDEAKTRLVACFFGPGEHLKVLAGSRTPPWLLRLEASGKPFIVENVYLTKDFTIKYSFVGHEGRFDGGYFADARECRHPYGSLIRHNNRTFIVEFSDYENPIARDVFEISGDPERQVEWNSGISSEEQLVAVLNDAPICGEFDIAKRDDGTWSLVAIAWSTSIDEDKLEASRNAIDDILETKIKLI